MNKKHWIIGIILIAVLILIGVFTRKTSSTTIPLGVIAGTTGDYAAAGEAYIKGFNLAMEEWNTQHTPKFSATIEDDGFNAQKGVAAYHKLKSANNVSAYAILSSFTIDAIIQNLNQETKPVALGFEQSTPATDDNVFQVLPAASPVQEQLGAYLKEKGYKKPAVVFSNNTSVYGNFLASFLKGYAAPIAQNGVGSMNEEASSLATKLLSQDHDVIVFYMNPKDGALLVKQILLQSEGSRPQFVFDQSVQSGITDYQTILGENLKGLNGSIVAFSKNDLTPSFKDAYQKKYSADPAFATDMGYNSFMLLAKTYNKDSATWIKNMKRANFKGADGNVSFDEVGLRLPTTSFGTFRDGIVK